jgi:hypothetical protein
MTVRVIVLISFKQREKERQRERGGERISHALTHAHRYTHTDIAKSVILSKYF